jgi:hypothetical protein
MIVGGFNGKYLTDYYIMKVDDNTNPREVHKYERSNK